MRRSAPFLGGAETVLAEQTAERLAAERNTFDLAKLLTEMMIVKTNIAGAGEIRSRIRAGRQRGLGRPRLACARAASPSSRIRFLKRLIWRTLKHRSSAALTHATSPFKEAEITATRCNSFWLTANVSLFMG